MGKTLNTLQGLGYVINQMILSMFSISSKLTNGHTRPQIPGAPPPPRHQPPSTEAAAVAKEDETTCEICIEPMTTINVDEERKYSNNYTNYRCSHSNFCINCIIKYIRVKLDHDNAGTIKCPAVGCGEALDPLDCAAVVGPAVFVRWCDVLCEGAVVGLDKCYCPNRSCNVLIVNECGGIVRKSICPRCRTWFCFECKRAWHAGFGCEESGVFGDRNDVAFGRLGDKENWRRCPRCRHFVELVEGCRIVRCRCGTNFCYNCGEQIQHDRCRCGAVLTCWDLCTGLFVVLIFLIYCVLHFILHVQ